MPPTESVLERFVRAQEGVYRDVLEELRRGRKTSHWMWFIFPQIAGLGSSAMSQRYAIASLAEARAYLAHPVLGARLRECASLVLAIEGSTAEQVFGPIDARKLRSSMTLFHRAAPDEPLFRQVLDRFHSGIPDAATDALLRSASPRPNAHTGAITSNGERTMEADDRWRRYGTALTGAMREVLDELPEESRTHALETADYWLSVGITLGLERPEQARDLLVTIEADEAERAALIEDAAAFAEDALP
jgi:uncharacterized protein (DUF1810 family)